MVIFVVNTSDMKQPFAFYEKIFNELIPFNQYVGMRLLELSEGYAKAIIPFQQHLLGDARVQAIHGGVISAAMDAVGGIAGITTLTSYEDKLVTIDMRVDHIRSARNTDLIVEARIVRSGNRIVTTNMQAFAATDNTLVAEGRGVYNASRKKND